MYPSELGWSDGWPGRKRPGNGFFLDSQDPHPIQTSWYTSHCEWGVIQQSDATSNNLNNISRTTMNRSSVCAVHFCL